MTLTLCINRPPAQRPGVFVSGDIKGNEMMLGFHVTIKDEPIFGVFDDTDPKILSRYVYVKKNGKWFETEIEKKDDNLMYSVAKDFLNSEKSNRTWKPVSKQLAFRLDTIAERYLKSWKFENG